METFSTLLTLCAGNSTVTGEFPPQRPMTRSLMFSLIYVWMNRWVNNREAGDLRHPRAHYDVIVMKWQNSKLAIDTPVMSYECRGILNHWELDCLFKASKLTTKKHQSYAFWPFQKGNHPDSKVHGANMGPIWGRQDPGEPHVGPMNFAIWAPVSDGGFPAQWTSNVESVAMSWLFLIP